MSVQIIIEVKDKDGAQSVLNALELYKLRLQSSVERTQRRLAEFEQRYQVKTEDFLESMTSEDLAGGDLEYVEWAGEAKILAGLEEELRELENARFQLPLMKT